MMISLQERVRNFANLCHKTLQTIPGRNEALMEISRLYSGTFTPEDSAMIDSDVVLAGFFDLLDHVGFEIEENSADDPMIRDYIIEELYSRAKIYIDIYTDVEVYKTNLRKRLITHEDTVIIQAMNMEDFVPALINEFYSKPQIKKSILRALVHFQNDELLNLFYQTVREEECLDITILSLIGLKRLGSRFQYWRLLKGESETFNDLVKYVEAFKPGEEPFHDSFQKTIFTLLYTELFIKEICDAVPFSWMIRLLQQSLEYTTDLSNAGTIYRSIVSILLQCDISYFRKMTEREEYIVTLANLINSIPREYIDRLIARLTLLGPQFRVELDALIACKAVDPASGESNLLCFLLKEAGSLI